MIIASLLYYPYAPAWRRHAESSAWWPSSQKLTSSESDKLWSGVQSTSLWGHGVVSLLAEIFDAQFEKEIQARSRTIRNLFLRSARLRRRPLHKEVSEGEKTYNRARGASCDMQQSGTSWVRNQGKRHRHHRRRRRRRSGRPPHPKLPSSYSTLPFQKKITQCAGGALI